MHLQGHDGDEAEVEVRELSHLGESTTQEARAHAPPQRRLGAGGARSEQVATVWVGVHHALLEHLGERRLDAESHEGQLRRVKCGDTCAKDKRAT